MMAMCRGNTKVVRILLGCNNIKIYIKNKYGETALHEAGIKNNIEGVKLFLEHPTCNKEIVNIKDKFGDTAEMWADKRDINLRGNQECARLVREYVENNDDEERDEDTQLNNLTLTEAARKIEEFNVSEPLMKTKMEEDQMKELEKYETECKRKRDAMLEEFETNCKRKRDAMLQKHNVENKRFCTKNEKTKKALHQELEKRLASSAGGAPGPSTPPPPSSPASLLPSCPVCYERMKPPLQIFTCGNGHLICSSCKPEVTMCYCQAMYTGRATAMEQMVRMILNIN